ncbi:MAG: tagaturonate epimerase family protein [Polyangiaceae bacterium]
MNLEKYSIGIGDRFGKQGSAQLGAVQRAVRLVKDSAIVPVWNKSHREHSLIGSTPHDVRAEADAAVHDVGWHAPYYVDADHIGMKTVDAFLSASNFFTLDVADFIGQPPTNDALVSFVADMEEFRGLLRIPGLATTFEVTEGALEAIGRQYLCAVTEAGRIYRHIAAAKGSENFVTEVSVDEATGPQTPLELFFILAALAREKIPVETVAPKFSGKFLKGIDYVGDLGLFAREFDADLAVVRHATDAFGLPRSLKISVHTGSDKFSLYPIIHGALQRTGAGLHLKTAGTTWLEEVAGIALSGAPGLRLAKVVYTRALSRYAELCKPYATVVEIDPTKLPNAATVEEWSSEQFVARLRHDPACPDYSTHLRQLVHVAFRIAAEMGEEFTEALDSAKEITGRCVAENLFERHLRPVFIGG